MIQARDIMTRNVVTVSMDMDLQSAALVFTTHRITGAPVIDSDRMLVGVLSVRDLVRNAARSLDAKDRRNAHLTRDELDTLADLRHEFDAAGISHLKVMDVMTPYAVSAAEDTPAVELAHIMVKEDVHRVLILDGGRLTGIVSSMDLVRAIANTPLGTPLRTGNVTPGLRRRPRAIAARHSAGNRTSRTSRTAPARKRAGRAMARKPVA